MCVVGVEELADAVDDLVAVEVAPSAADTNATMFASRIVPKILHRLKTFRDGIVLETR
jgi:hypothetical protein